MPKKRMIESPYKSGCASAFTVRENYFNVSEPRLRECFGEIYDAALKANPLPAVSWRDALFGALVSTVIATVYEGLSMDPFSWRGLIAHLVCCGLLLVASLAAWGKQATSVAKSRGDISKRTRIINAEFRRVVEISQEDSAS